MATCSICASRNQHHLQGADSGLDVLQGDFDLDDAHAASFMDGGCPCSRAQVVDLGDLAIRHAGQVSARALRINVVQFGFSISV